MYFFKHIKVLLSSEAADGPIQLTNSAAFGWCLVLISHADDEYGDPRSLALLWV